MRERLVVSGLALVALVAVGSCSDDVGPATAERFVASLSGAGEPTPVTTSATGRAEFTVFEGIPALFYQLDVTGPFTDSVTAAHIHGPADATQSVGVLVNLYVSPPRLGPGIAGTVAQGVAPAPSRITFDSLLVLLRAGQAYVNVHTVTNPGGEIRGQIARQ